MSPSLVTRDIARSHVIPDEVLFTKPVNKSKTEQYHFRLEKLRELMNMVVEPLNGASLTHQDVDL